jgi:hypothetical protein
MLFQPGDSQPHQLIQVVQPQPDTKKLITFNRILVGLVVVFAVLFFISIFFLVKKTPKSTTKQQTAIQGIIDLNGVVPSGSTVTLSARPVGATEPFQPFLTGLAAADMATWRYTQAAPNQSYEIQASVIHDGAIISQSAPITMTAPATKETITLNVESTSQVATPSAQLSTALISGTIQIEGYVPSGATVTLQGRQKGTPFTTIIDSVPAQNGQLVSFAAAQAGTLYEIQGTLFDSTHAPIGISQLLTVAAPAKNEVLTINSTAQAPAVTTAPQTSPQPTFIQNAEISGSIILNGAAPTNTRITIFERLNGTSSYQVAMDNISAIDQTRWKWDGGTVGKIYDFVAVLKQHQTDGTDKDLSSSNTVTVAAPATSQSFVINSGFILPAPNGSISISCSDYNETNDTWTAHISVASVTGAQSYWYQIGTTNGGIELAAFTQNAMSGSTQTFTKTFEDGTTYYARYAYAQVPNLLGYSTAFSPFSPTTQLQCNH